MLIELLRNDGLRLFLDNDHHVDIFRTVSPDLNTSL